MRNAPKEQQPLQWMTPDLLSLTKQPRARRQISIDSAKAPASPNRSCPGAPGLPCPGRQGRGIRFVGEDAGGSGTLDGEVSETGWNLAMLKRTANRGVQVEAFDLHWGARLEESLWCGFP